MTEITTWEVICEVIHFGCRCHRTITCKYQTIYGSIIHILTSYLVWDGLKWCLIHYFAISCTPLSHGNRDDLGVHVPLRPPLYGYLLPQSPRNPPMFPQRLRSSQQQLLVMTSNRQKKKQYMKQATLREVGNSYLLSLTAITQINGQLTFACPYGGWASLSV